MRKGIAACAALVVLAACATARAPGNGPTQSAAATDAAHVATAIADPRRPEADRARDSARRPADILAFAQIGAGDRVADLLPGGGYFTRLFAVAVGADGRVFPVIRAPGVASEYETPIIPVAAEYPNAVVVQQPFAALAFPELLDVFFTAQNYHDLYIAEYDLGDAAALNRAVFSALKPGGLYVLIDHSAVAGADLAAATAIHRIDQASVRREIEAAGFVFEAESDLLRNAADPRTANVFDPAIRGRTDQFVMRFRKPQ